ncbi:MAG: translation initiation factor IF-6, partial [Halobacteriaceae archaeon]
MLRAAFSGSSYIGVFSKATNKCVFLRPDLEEDLINDIGEELEVPSLTTTIGGSSTIGSLIAGNEHGLVVSERIRENERETITTYDVGNVVELPGKINAAGNVILANDSGAYVHPDLSRAAVNTIEEGLDVPVYRGSIADVHTVGTAAIANNNGVLCHPKTSEDELEAVEEALDVRADIGT